jgi:hypothetical protein
MNALLILLTKTVSGKYGFPTKDTITPTWNLNLTVVEYLLQSRELLVTFGSLLSIFLIG